MIDLNPDIDIPTHAQRFRAQGWVQVKDVLTTSSAAAVLELLDRRTAWGLAWRAGEIGPFHEDAAKFAQMSPADHTDRRALLEGARRSDAVYSHVYRRCPLDEPPHRAILESVNSASFLDFLRTLSGDQGIVHADGQATLFGPGNYIAAHDDHIPVAGRRLAYVLNLTKGEWRPEWGGYLHFYDGEGNVEVGIRPRFNSLNIFSIPRWHSVSRVQPEAPIARFAITGWGRDR